MEKDIIFLGKTVTLYCDGKCNKAWGTNTRPRHEDETFLFDSELGDAPLNPGTYEGGQGKPRIHTCNDSSIMNKWCCRECERASFIPRESREFMV